MKTLVKSLLLTTSLLFATSITQANRGAKRAKVEITSEASAKLNKLRISVKDQQKLANIFTSSGKELDAFDADVLIDVYKKIESDSKSVFLMKKIGEEIGHLSDSQAKLARPTMQRVLNVKSEGIIKNLESSAKNKEETDAVKVLEKITSEEIIISLAKSSNKKALENTTKILESVLSGKSNSETIQSLIKAIDANIQGKDLAEKIKKFLECLA